MLASLRLSVFLSALAVAPFAQSAEGAHYDISVPAMHCSECSEALTTTFSKRPEVATAQADLEKHQVSLTLKPGQTMSEKTMKQLVKASGFEAGKITRD